jgi:four helix bundle protein
MAGTDYGANDIQKRTLAFGVEIVNFVDTLPSTTAGRAVGRQIVRSGTAVGALMEEADAAESRADFIHKVSISLKEARETRYWLRLVLKSNLSNQMDHAATIHLGREADELVRILFAIRNSARNNTSK